MKLRLLKNMQRVNVHDMANDGDNNGLGFADLECVNGQCID
jgi:hypothetical protein